MRKAAARVLIPLVLAGLLAGPAAGVRREPRVKPQAAITPVRWALRAVNFLETRAGGSLGLASSVCEKAQVTQNWQRLQAETRTLKDYLLAAQPARLGLVVQSSALTRLLRPFVKGSQRAHVANAKSQLLAAARDHRASFQALHDGANALDAHDCATARIAWSQSGLRAVAGQDEARQGLFELRSAGFKFVDPDWAYE
jgi:hypothetical protein